MEPDPFIGRTIGSPRVPPRLHGFVERRIAEYLGRRIRGRWGQNVSWPPPLAPFSMSSPLGFYIGDQDDLEDLLDCGVLEAMIGSVASSCRRSRDDVLQWLRIHSLPISPPLFVAGDLHVRRDRGVFDELSVLRVSARTPVVESMTILKSSKAKAVVAVQHTEMFRALLTPEFCGETGVIAIGPGGWSIGMGGVLLARKVAATLRIPVLVLANQSTAGLLLFLRMYFGDALLRGGREKDLPVRWIPWGKKIRSDKPIVLMRDRGAPELRRMLKHGLFSGLETEDLARSIAVSGQMIELEAMSVYGIPRSRNILRRAVAASVRRSSRRLHGRLPS